MRLADKIATMARRGAPLPYLRRVAYLESHGAEWIDTGIKPKAGMTFATSVARILSSPSNLIFWGVREIGSYLDTGKQCYLNSNLTNTSTSVTAFYTYSASSNSADYNLNWFSDVIQSIGVMYDFDDMLVNPNLVTFTRSILLFGFNSVGNVNTSVGVCRIGRFSVLDSDVLVSKFIPVLDLSGRPAMFDEVSGQFFYNQGTGEFTWGELDASSSLSASRGGVLNA